jgi:hypothetical protein
MFPRIRAASGVPQNTKQIDRQAIVTTHADIPVSNQLTTISLAKQLDGKDTSMNMYRGGTDPANYMLSSGDAVFTEVGGVGVPISRTGPSKAHGMNAHYSLNGKRADSYDPQITGEEMNSKFVFAGISKSAVDPSDNSSVNSGLALIASGGNTCSAPSNADIHFGDKTIAKFPNTNDLNELSHASKLAQGSSTRIMPLIQPVTGVNAHDMVDEKMQKLLLYPSHDSFSSETQARINTGKTNLKKAIASMSHAAILLLLKRGLLELNLDPAAAPTPSFTEQEMMLANIFDLTKDPFKDDSDLNENTIINDILRTVFTNHPERDTPNVVFPTYQEQTFSPEKGLMANVSGNEAMFGSGPALSTRVKIEEYIQSMTNAEQSLTEACVLHPRETGERIVGTILTNSNSNAHQQKLMGMFINSTTVLN